MKSYANSKNEFFKLTSALDNKGINDLFEEIIDVYLKIKPKHYNNINQPIETKNNYF
jgi:hypothetical protein